MQAAATLAAQVWPVRQVVPASAVLAWPGSARLGPTRSMRLERHRLAVTSDRPERHRLAVMSDRPARCQGLPARLVPGPPAPRRVQVPAPLIPARLGLTQVLVAQAAPMRVPPAH
jgi:hypothetical protein